MTLKKSFIGADKHKRYRFNPSSFLSLYQTDFRKMFLHEVEIVRNLKSNLSPVEVNFFIEETLKKQLKQSFRLKER